MVPKTENHPSLTFRKITCNILQYITVSVIALYIIMLSMRSSQGAQPWSKVWVLSEPEMNFCTSFHYSLVFLLQIHYK